MLIPISGCFRNALSLLLIWTCATMTAVTASGATVELPARMRGISTSEKYLKPDLFALLAQTDANSIRVGFSMDYTNPSLPTPQNPLLPYTNNLATLDAALPLARVAGIKIVICAAETYGWSPTVFQGSAADLATYRTNLATFWTAMAAARSAMRRRSLSRTPPATLPGSPPSNPDDRR